MFAAITLCDACQRVFIAVRMYFFIDSVRKLLDTTSYIHAFLTSALDGQFYAPDASPPGKEPVVPIG
jgi:hypothetical protein